MEAVATWQPQKGDILPDDLAEAQREVCEVIGLEAYLALVEWRGGLILSVPKRFKTNNYIVKVIGEDAAKPLFHHYGSTRIALPLMSSIAIPARNRAIRKDYDAGSSPPELVRRYDLSSRTIWTVLGEV